jgi:hypothetical protein
MRDALGKGILLNAKNTIIVQYREKKKEDRRRKTEVRRQKSEDRRQKTEDRPFALCPTLYA